MWFRRGISKLNEAASALVPPDRDASEPLSKDCTGNLFKSLRDALRGVEALSLEQGPLLAYIFAINGNLVDIARCACVSSAWKDAVDRKDIRKWTARWSPLSAELRPFYWLHCAGIPLSPPPNDLYAKLVIAGAGNTKWLEDILTDVERSYEGCGAGLRGRKDLYIPGACDDDSCAVPLRVFRVLLATSAVDSDVGYCQGADHVCRAIVEVLMGSEAFSRKMSARSAEEAAFSLFNALMFEPYGMARMYAPGMKPLQIRCLQLASLLRLFLPGLCDHFKKEGVVVEFFSVGWIQTLFVYMGTLPPAILRKIWDIFLAERSWKIIFRSALALLKLAEPELKRSDLDQTLAFLNQYPLDLEPAVFLDTALSFRVTGHRLTALEKKWRDRASGS